MNHVTQQIVLTSPHSYGWQLPPQPIGQTLVAIPDLVRQSIDMAFRGQSAAKGKRPRWLREASDIALVGVAGGEKTILTFEAPTLAEAAPELYRQGEFSWSSRPDGNDTGFDLLGDVLRDVSAGNAESERFDSRLLAEIWGTRRVLHRAFSELALPGLRHGRDEPAFLNASTLASAKQLHDKTLRPQAAIVVGRLDMIQHSTQTFAMIMDDGQEVRCVMAEDDVECLTPLFKHRVAVSGRVVFRASGRVLRVEAESVRDAVESDRFFAKIPRPNAQRFDLRRVLREQGHKRGLAAIIGKWPGDETDEEIDKWLKEIS